MKGIKSEKGAKIDDFGRFSMYIQVCVSVSSTCILYSLKSWM